MSKICTSIKQSKKLLKLGIDPKSADMCWIYANREHFCAIDEDGLLEPLGIPAWSLSALLELIPLHLKEFKNGIDFEFSKAMNNKKWYSAHYTKFSDKGLANFDKTITGDTAVDAVFEMIVWLKENKKI